MIVQLPAAVVDADQANLEEMGAFLAQLGVEVGMRLADVEQLEAALSGPRPPQLVVVNLDPDPQATLARLSSVLMRYPSADVFVMSERTDPQLLMDAMHLGVKEFITLPVQADRLRRGIERVTRTRRGNAPHAKLVTFIPTSGGCGATTAACNVAVAMAKKGSTALIDLDLVGGSVAEALDLRPRFTIADVAGGKLDRQVVSNVLTQHKPSGLAVLARPEAPEDALKVDAATLSQLLATMAEAFDYIVIDSVLSVDPVHMAAAKASDEIVLAVQMNVPSVRNAARYLQVLRRMSIQVGSVENPGRVRLVATRSAHRATEVSAEAVEKALGLKVGWTIPNDFKSATDALNYGEPLVLRSPRAEVSTSLSGLAHVLNGRATHEAGAKQPVDRPAPLARSVSGGV